MKGDQRRFSWEKEDLDSLFKQTSSNKIDSAETTSELISFDAEPFLEVSESTDSSISFDVDSFLEVSEERD